MRYFLILLSTLPVLASREHCREPLPPHEAEPSSVPSDGQKKPDLHKAGRHEAVFAENGMLYVAFLHEMHLYVTMSADEGKTFRPPVAVNREPQKIRFSGENRPKIRVDRQGRLFICYTKSLPARWSGDLMFSRSIDGGQTFEKPIRINDDSEMTGHAFAVMDLDQKGRLYLAWLDGRDRLKARKENREWIGSSIYATWSDDGGQHFVANRQWATQTCQCCRMALTFDPKHRLILVWRHIFGDHIRDHAWGRFDPETEQFSFRRLTDDQWRIEGCPHQGPALTMGRDGSATVTWYTVINDEPRLYLGRIDPNGMLRDATRIPGNRPRHPALYQRDRTMVLVFEDDHGDATALQQMSSQDAGQTWTRPHLLQQGTGVTDHPALLADGNRLFVGWHTAAGFSLWQCHIPQEKGSFKEGPP